MDNDLKHKTITGILLIEKYSLQFESYLVTGMADDERLKARARASGVRLVSKGDIHKIKIDLTGVSESQEIGLEVS